jgi:type I restriction enzyme S subunit
MIDGLKPYPAMKDSGVPWLGEVPAHWDVAAVRRYCRVFAGATPSRAVPDYWNGGSIPWLVSGDVNHRRIFRANQFITKAGFEASSTKWIRPESLVLALAGQGKTKGMVATVECWTTCNQSLAAIEPSALKSDYRFLAYYLESRYLDLRALVGDGLRDGLNLEHVCAILAPLPPLSEQAAIVRFLDHADRQIRRYIRARQQMIKLLEEQKQAIIHRAVTRGLDPNVRLKPSGVEWLGEVPAHWEVWQVGHFADIGNGSTPSRGNVGYWSGGVYPWLNSSSVNAGTITASDQFVTDMALRECHLPRVPADSLLVAITGQGKTRGKAAILTIEATINQHIAFITLRKRDTVVTPEYLQKFFAAAYSELRCLSDNSGSTKGALTCEDLRHFSVLLPPIVEQREIVQWVENATSEVEVASRLFQREISLLREYRTRLIADVVTGKRDVREVAARLPEEVEASEPFDEAEAEGDADETAPDDTGAVPEETEA